MCSSCTYACGISLDMGLEKYQLEVRKYKVWCKWAWIWRRGARCGKKLRKPNESCKPEMQENEEKCEGLLECECIKEWEHY